MNPVRRLVSHFYYQSCRSHQETDGGHNESGRTIPRIGKLKLQAALPTRLGGGQEAGKEVVLSATGVFAAHASRARRKWWVIGLFGHLGLQNQTGRLEGGRLMR